MSGQLPNASSLPLIELLYRMLRSLHTEVGAYQAFRSRLGRTEASASRSICLLVSEVPHRWSSRSARLNVHQLMADLRSTLATVDRDGVREEVTTTLLAPYLLQDSSQRDSRSQKDALRQDGTEFVLHLPELVYPTTFLEALGAHWRVASNPKREAS